MEVLVLHNLVEISTSLVLSRIISNQLKILQSSGLYTMLGKYICGPGMNNTEIGMTNDGPLWCSTWSTSVDLVKTFEEMLESIIIKFFFYHPKISFSNFSFKEFPFLYSYLLNLLLFRGVPKHCEMKPAKNLNMFGI